jgi:hypothetical protein
LSLILAPSLQPLAAEEDTGFDFGGFERRQAAREQYPELPQRLENPLARIHLLPISFSYVDGGGTDSNGEVYSTEFAPRIPFTINERWHVLLKSDIRWIKQRNVFNDTTQEGWSDMKLSFFATPERSLGKNMYWGLGPTLLLPTASEDLLGTDKVSVGPSIGIYGQDETWTTGILMSHIWSVAGDSDAPDISLTRLEPQLAYTATTATTFALSSETLYDHENDYWSVPLEFRISQLTLFRKRPIQFGLGFKYYLTDERYTPDWGIELQISIPIETSRFKRLKRALGI